MQGVTFKTSDKQESPIKIKPKRLSHILQNLTLYKNGNGKTKSDRFGKYPKSSGLGEIIQLSIDEKKTIDALENGFVNTVVNAYCFHHNLILRPDDFWMAILNQFSLYVNANAEILRDKFVKFKDKKNLVVVDTTTLRTANYGDLSKRMTDEIQKKLKDPTIKDWIIPSFSTTTDNDVISASVVMMATMSSYFTYEIRLCCGIPNVTLLGTIDDYIDLRSRIDNLLKFDVEDEDGDNFMELWHSYLIPIFDELINAVSGKPNYDFWTKICDYRPTGSGPTYLSGWITAFCVFDKKGYWQGDCTTVELPRGYTIENNYPIINIKSIPPGYNTVEVLVDDNGKKYETVMFAGNFSMEMVNENTLQPRSDWALVLKS